MIKTKNIIDGIIGGLGFFIFSIFASTYDKNPEYLKITAYLWGIPLFFFYLVYITASHSKEAMIAFTKHGLIGTALTVFVMIFTRFLRKGRNLKLLPPSPLWLWVWACAPLLPPVVGCGCGNGEWSVRRPMGSGRHADPRIDRRSELSYGVGLRCDARGCIVVVANRWVRRPLV